MSRSNSTSVPMNPSSSYNSSSEKRKRVARACDNCRQKKVKCDGKQPCIHCTVYSYKCTYDQPNIRNKKVSGFPVPAQSSPMVQVAAAAAGSSGFVGNRMAKNLIQCQNLLNILLPKLNLNCLDENNPLNLDFDKLQKAVAYVESKNQGAVNLAEVCDLYDSDSPVSPPLYKSPHAPLTYFEDSPNREFKLIIPSKEIALKLIYVTWYKACVLFRFYHRPSLLEEVDLLYSLEPSAYGDRQQKFLPFLYSLLACGSLFSKSSDSDSDINDNLEDDGFKYFLEARKLIDISNVSDIHSIQTIVMMIMYLQCSARLSTCYSYIGIALRSALKEGLHRNLTIFQNSKRKLDPIEVDTRKRLFYTIYKMDIYINSLLGLPRSIQDDEFDQELPEELDDENITRDSYLYDKQQGALSSSGCANHHTKLMFILSHIVKKLYPIKVGKSATNVTPDHIHSKVTELEIELKQWLQNLPKELKPTDPNDPNSSKDIPEKFVMANYYLHLSFLNCQIMLYRPFIHFISNGSTSYQNSDPRSLIRGRNCIKVARMVVKLSNKMIDQNLLVGTYWFSMYTIFFSIACLVYYYHFANYGDFGNGAKAGLNTNESGMNYAGVLFDDDLNIDMIKKDIEIGKKVLDCLKNNSNASLRIYNILNALFEQLNRRTANSSRLRNMNQQNADTDIKPNYQSENVQATFQNFNTINEYQSDLKYPNEETKPVEIYQFESPIEGRISDNGIDIGGEHSSNPRAGKRSVTEVSLEPFDIKATPVAEQLSVKSSVSQESEQVDYLPGVFDKLDAQIFGRILPPYMLEKNAKSSTVSLLGFFNEDQELKQMDQTVTHPNIQVDPMNLNNLSNLDISILEDNTDMNYLDPFNPINGS
ncbi:uncharacterized protein CANTADRAFT_50927 [Suhomyces tanzawaensis NRRL Y-17324]|uniref:Zn(2)-C6 fungal-type domain-containing protein n=1 Tax=Suhomyces tanzawaensis NRRL Y-17324 TaxID=984487 RepID=A0A1E4SIS6_9ASCO|nr:uncharacterized protein CANTADRAFT_50927 [Suhomyces tanzawaensis NRRL Y-17324]ODV79413.1 hypothetical protein CANTADRAFT_50927 [Suhomyces tanzawaensis NRRL Y-17324]